MGLSNDFIQMHITQYYARYLQCQVPYSKYYWVHLTYIFPLGISEKSI